MRWNPRTERWEQGDPDAGPPWGDAPPVMLLEPDTSGDAPPVEYVTTEDYFGGGGVDRHLPEVAALAPTGESESPFPLTPNLDERLPDISRYAPSTQFAPEFVDAGYRRDPRRQAEPDMTMLQNLAPAVQAGLETAEPLTSKLGAVGEFFDREAAIKAGKAKAAEKLALGEDPGELAQRPGESIEAYGQRIWDTNPLPEGAIGVTRAVYDPAQILPGIGITDDLVKAGLQGGARAASRGVRAAAKTVDNAFPAVGRALADETGAIRLGGAGDDAADDLVRSSDAGEVPQGQGSPPPPPSSPASGPTFGGLQNLLTDEAGVLNLGALFPPSSPPAPPIPAGGPLDKTLRMFDDVPKGPPLGQRVADGYRGFQEQFTDRLAGVNGLTSKARKELAATGNDLPMELNAENLAARVPGAGEAGVQRIRDMVKDVRAVLDKGAWPGAEDHLNAYLRRMHDLDVLREKGGGRLVVGGLKGAPEVNQALAELAAHLGPQRWTQIEDAAKIVIAHNQDGMDRMVVSGLMAPDLAAELKRMYPHYTPTRIMKVLAEEADGISKRKVSVTSNNLKRFTMEGTEDAAARPLDALMESMMQREALIARNDAARAFALLAEQQGIGKRVGATRKVATIVNDAGDEVAVYRRPPGEIPGTISFMEDGKRVVYEVPTWLEKEAKVLREVDFGPVGRFLSAVNTIPRKAFVTYNPVWPIANFAIDTFTNIMQGADVREIAKGLAGAIKDIGNNDPVLAEMRRLGAGQAGYFGKTPQDISREVKKAGGLVIESKLDMQRFMRNPLRLIGRVAEGQENIGRALEMANRRAAFTTALKSGASPEEAALAARRNTLDFNRGGQFVRQANTAFLFLNAGVQGSLLPYRMLRDNPKARIILGAALGAKFASDAYNVQYPEYQDIPRHIRYGSWIVMLPSVERDGQGRPKPNYISVIPNTREWATFLGPVTYLTEKLAGAAQPEFAQFVATVLPRVQPLGGPVDLMPTQLANVVLETSMNKDFYRNKPIVPPELEGKPVTEQYDERTSESIKALAQKMGVSPLQLQHVVFGLTGGTGKAALDVIDPAFASLNPKPEDFRIADLAAKYEAIQAPDVPEGEVALRRREFLGNLSTADQEALLSMTRKRSDVTPFLTALERRFHGGQGGELRRLGQEKAEAAMGVSAKQTVERGRAIGDFVESERKRQEAQDKVLEDNPGMGKEWREAHKAKGIGFQAALRAFDVVFPSAADMKDSDKWREYQGTVHTIAGAIDDRRTKGQLLVAGYRAIPLEEIDPLTPDFDTFFQRRAEYKAALPKEDQELLDRELTASMTPTERKFAKDMEVVRPYWDVEAKVAEALGPDVQRVVAEYEKATPAKRQELERTVPYRVFDRTLDVERKKMRANNKDVDRVLIDWYGYQPVVPPNSLPKLPLMPLQPLKPVSAGTR